MTADVFDAIVVGGVDFGEADRVVYLLTPFGRLSAFAHGARKSRRRFAGALDPFVTVRATLETRKKARMPTLSAAVVGRSRLALRGDLERIALASYVAELSAAVAPEGAPAPELFALVEEVLDALEMAAICAAARRAFELRLLEVLGYEPDLSGCTACGEPQPELAFIDFHRGGLLCAAHRDGARVVGPKTRRWMEGVLASDHYCAHDGRGEMDADWANTAAGKVGPAMDAFFSILVTRALRSVDMLTDLGL